VEVGGVPVQGDGKEVGGALPHQAPPGPELQAHRLGEELLGGLEDPEENPLGA